MIKTALAPVVILAGGLATRLRPLTTTMPKALIEINNKPFIAHQLDLLKAKGITKVVICIGYLGEQIIEYIGNGAKFGLDISYSQDGDKLLGTAGAIKKALPLLSDYFFIMYGDSYLNCDYAGIQHKFVAANKLGLMTVYKNLGKWDTSNVVYENDEIIVYDKKQRLTNMHYIDYGLGMMHRAVFDQVPNNEAFDLANLYQLLLSQKQLAAFEVTERFYEIGSLAGIEETKEYLSNY